MGPSIPFTRLDSADPALLEELLTAVGQVARRSAFIGGEEVDAFEDEFATYCETAFSVGVSSGTEALTLALRALEVGPGDEVILPANTFIATAEAVSLVGATPRLVDVDPETHLLTADTVEGAIGPRTRCVIPVHLYGRTVEMDPLLELTRREGLAVVEDACQAHGARYRGKRVGALGDAGCFSFYPAKNLGAWGDGGAVATNRPELDARIRLLRSHGERPRYRHRMVGTTARLDGLQAAVLRIKLRRLDGWNAQRRQAADELRRALRGTSVLAPAAPADGCDHVYHLFVVRSEERDLLRTHLAERGIASAVHYPVAVHLTEAYAHLGYKPGSLPVAEEMAEEICSLPLFPGMDETQISAVGAAVSEAPTPIARTGRSVVSTA